MKAPASLEDVVNNIRTIALNFGVDEDQQEIDQRVVAAFKEMHQLRDAIRPDMEIVANLAQPLPFLYEQNYSLDLGIPDSSWASLAQHLAPGALEFSDKIDRRYLEFSMMHKLKPFDYVFRFYTEIECPNPDLKRICRTVLIIAATNEGLPSHAAVFINNITNHISKIKYPGFEVSFRPEMKSFEPLLYQYITEGLPEKQRFTTRECEIIKLMAGGMSSKMIADELSISKHTVDTHRRKMLKKLEVANAAGILGRAQELGII